MEETDDIKLLKECDAGVQMAISSIDEVLEKISDDQLKELLEESREHHEKNLILWQKDCHGSKQT